MHLDELRELHEHRPFNPFTIHMVDGHPFDIVTPQYLAIHPNGRMALVWHVTGRGHSYIALDAITRVSHIDAPLSIGSES